MGIISSFKNLIKDRNPTEVVVKIMRENGSNAVYSWNGDLFDNGDVRAMVRPFVMAAGKLDPKHIRYGVDKNGDPDVKVNPVSLRHISTDSIPDVAVETVIPYLLKILLATTRFMGSSSTTRA